MELPQSYISLLNCFWCGFMLKLRCALINFWLKAGPHGKGLSTLTQKNFALSLFLWINSLLSNVDYSGLDLFFFFLALKTDNSLHMVFDYSPSSGFGVALQLGLAWSLYFQSVLNYLSMKSYRSGADAFQQWSLTSITFLTVFMEFAVFLILEKMNYCGNNKYTLFSQAILHNSFCHPCWYSHARGISMCK